MSMHSEISRKFWIHPILLGVYPVLALYVFNRNEMVFPAIWQALVTSLIVMMVTVGLFLLIFRSWQRAAIHASLTLLFFFSYGHIFDLVRSINFLGEPIGHRIFFPFWILLFALGQVILTKLKNSVGLNQFLNPISLFLMIFLLVPVLSSFLQSQMAGRNFSDKAVASLDIPVGESGERDVYYILVDGYSRSDLLQQKLNFDTSDFLSELKNLGFYIPECAQSNYDHTLQSLSSSLNMDYLDALGVDYLADKARFQPYIQDNLVMKRFRAMGYSTATFKSLHPMLDLPDSTYYYDYFENTSALNSQASLNFQYLFLRTTLVRPLIQWIESNQNVRMSPFWSVWIPVANTLNSRDYQQYQQSIFALDSLHKIPDLPGKKFVYAHLFVTHQPFVFYSDGRFHPFQGQDYNAYKDQVVFLNKRLLEIIKDILARSDPAPIIVIQGDHSYFEAADLVKILNAYYFPDNGDRVLYPTVTPVNTFRLIFNTYFGDQYPLLPDVSRYIDDGEVLREAPMTCVQVP